MKSTRPVANRFVLYAPMLIFVVLLALQGIALGASPYLSYVYPAGGQKGTTFTVLIGGQNLRGVSAAEVSGDGVRVSIAGYVGSGGPLNAVQQEELKRLISDYTLVASGKKKKSEVAKSTVAFPDLPDLRNLDRKTVAELRDLSDKYTNASKRPVPPMAEQVTLKVTVDSRASLGNRELRLRTSSGYSNPVVFQISSFREVSEPEAVIDKTTDRTAAEITRVPVVLNGQIMPGDVDRFPLELKAGQKLMAVAYARTLIPYLADAVPGWFQAVLTLYDANGKEVAYADDCGYDPDPVLTFQVPKDTQPYLIPTSGTYYLEIRDSIYRGRRDFVYRVAVAEASLVQTLLPGASRGGVHFDGSGNITKADTPTEANAFPAWSSLPIITENEPDNTTKQAITLTFPQAVRGHISKVGDIDYYQFNGKAGDEIVAEVYARRAGSPLDSLLRLMDANGQLLAWNDDTPGKNVGLLVHQADSYIRYRLPETGTYTLQVSDVQHHGGSDYAYSLRVSPPLPDFALWATPSALSIAAGNTAVITIDAARADGWNGAIEVVLKDAPAGYVLGGAIIPPGRNQIRITLAKSTSTLEFLQLEGRAVIGSETITRPVQPADRWMQAFAYYHLIPSQNSKISVVRTSSSSTPVLSVVEKETVRIPAAGNAEVHVNIKPMPTVPVRLELREPPAGVSLKETRVLADGIVLVLAADDKHTGYTDNLIVEAFTETETPGKDGAPPVRKKTSIGVLPAIPIVIVP